LLLLPIGSGLLLCAVLAPTSLVARSLGILIVLFAPRNRDCRRDGERSKRHCSTRKADANTHVTSS
jgi:hypothetical protein